MELVLLGLPLGNIKDISLRAIETLKEAKLIICEDSRVFRKLWLKLVNMGYLTGKYQGKLEVVNEYNEKNKVEMLLAEIGLVGKAVLVSDAGMPLISDPGFRLTKKFIEMGGKVTSVPGPSAGVTAVCLSGLSSDKFLFLGFLPKKRSKREKYWGLFKILAGFGVTVVIYEPARSVLKTLLEIKKEFIDLRVVVARELTKKYEEIIRGKIENVVLELDKKKIKGEVVLLLRLEKNQG